MKDKNRGFTLVELIVVLVILAILAALLIPALIGYIDKAKEKQFLFNAENCLTAAQAQLVNLYATTGGNIELNKSIIPGSGRVGNNGDCDATATEFTRNVLELADMTGVNEPYCFMIAVGSNVESSTTVHDKYTVFYALYIEKEGTTPLYYYCGEWTDQNPREKGKTEIFDSRNVIKNGPYKGKRLQYYSITNHYSKSIYDSAYWNWLKKE